MMRVSTKRFVQSIAIYSSSSCSSASAQRKWKHKKTDNKKWIKRKEITFMKIHTNMDRDDFSSSIKETEKFGNGISELSFLNKAASKMKVNHKWMGFNLKCEKWNFVEY